LGIVSFRLNLTWRKDTVMVNWAPSMIEMFKPSDVVDKPDGLEERYFEAHVERVTSFQLRHEKSTPEEVQRSLLSAMLGSLDNDYVGKYWNFFAYAAYTKGYTDPETVRLSYMCAQHEFPSKPIESNCLVGSPLALTRGRRAIASGKASSPRTSNGMGGACQNACRRWRGTTRNGIRATS
jgi:hypothetical protein